MKTALKWDIISLIMIWLEITMRAFEKLPAQFQNDSVKAYYDILSKRQGSIILKRVFDIIVSLILIDFLFIHIAVISLSVIVIAPGPVLFK